MDIGKHARLAMRQNNINLTLSADGLLVMDTLFVWDSEDLRDMQLTVGGETCAFLRTRLREYELSSESVSAQWTA